MKVHKGEETRENEVEAGRGENEGLERMNQCRQGEERSGIEVEAGRREKTNTCNTVSTETTKND